MPRLTLLAAFCSGLVACAGGQAPGNAEPERPKPGAPRDTLVIALPTAPQHLLWPVSGQAVESQILDAVSFGAMDPEFQCRLTWEPQVAAAWEFSPDGRSVTLRLREDLTWEDGAPVNAEDLRFTYDLLADPKVASPRADLVTRLAPSARPAVLDAYTVRFDFTAATDRATMLSMLNARLAPRHLLDSPQIDRAALRDHPLARSAPVGMGPFRVAEWTADRVVLEPNPAFTGPKKYQPKLARVEFRVIPDAAARLAALRAGEVDLVENLAVRDADSLVAEHSEFQLRRRGWRNLDQVVWNTVDPLVARAAREAGQPLPADLPPHPILGDREVRRALAQAVDTGRLLRELLTSEATGEVYGRPAVGTISPALCGVHNDAIVRLPYDPEATRARLAALGWGDENHDGVLDRGGRPFRLTMLVNAENDRRRAVADRLRADFAAVGVDLVVEPVETPEALLARLHLRDFDAALSGWTAGLFIDPELTWAPESSFNFSGYRNPRVAELIAQGNAEPDYDKARPIWQELQRVIYEDQPHLFLYWADEIVAVHSRFQNAVIDIAGAYRRLWQWSVPVDRVKYKAAP